MPPKKAVKEAPQASPLPSIEDEVPFPQGVGPVSDPPFAFALVHVAGGPFGVEGAAGAGEGDPLPLRVVDPCQLILARLKAEAPSADALDRQVVPVEREELEVLAEGGHLAKALRLKVERESGARRRRKVNAARRRTIAAASGQPTGEAREQPLETEVDFMLLLVGYPSTAEELEEVRAEGVFDLPDAWVSAFLAAESVVEDRGPDAASLEVVAAPPRRRRAALEPPAVLAALYDAIHAADRGTGLANSSICTLRDCQLLVQGASPEDPTAGGARLLEGLLSAAGAEAGRRRRFARWREAVEHWVEIPPLEGDGRAQPDTRLYDRLARSVAVAQQDVPLLLHCLCEQVAATLGGDVRDVAGGGPAANGPAMGRPAGNLEELQLLDECLGGAHNQLLLGDLPGEGRRRAGGAEGAAETGLRVAVDGPADEAEGGDGPLVLPYLDRASRVHAGDRLPGAVSAATEVLRLLSHVRLPGIRREGFPEVAPRTAAQRSAMRNRFYSLMPGYPTVEVERMLLLRDFERLLEEAQPERAWCLGEWVFHERIPSSLLVQVLLDAVLQEYLLDTKYDERRDRLLIALHRRAPRGRELWHVWAGDLLAPADGPGAPLCSEPTFNDWRELVSGEAHRLAALDAREMGYCRIVEQAVLPADGSTVLCTRLQRGLAESFPRLSAVAGAAEPEFTAPPKWELRVARVLKNGIAFGVATDQAWTQRVEELRGARAARERAAAEVVAVAAAAAAARAEAEALRRAQGLPPSPEGAADASAGPALEDEVPAAPTSRRLEDLRFGRFWLAFADGARCSARLHHERPWYPEGTIFCGDVVQLPTVHFVYLPASGFLLRVLGDGTVCQHFPRQARAAEVALARSGAASRATPGGPGDVEVARMVTPSGVLTRELLSGRTEVYHPDGTRALRNPTLPEVQSRLDGCRADGSWPEAALLAELVAALGEQRPSSGGRGHASRLEAAGLPGHWLVTRPDGRVFGRAAAPPRGPPAAASVGGEELLGGTLVDGGAVMEYEVEPVSTSVVLDPHTGQRVCTCADGLVVVEDLHPPSRVLLLADGTRLAFSGQHVAVEHGRLAQIACHADESVEPPQRRVRVACDDGTELEVVPQRLGPSSADLAADRPPGATGKTTVLLRRRDGTTLLSKGDGDVDVVSGADIAAFGEPGAPRTAARGAGTYLAQLDGARLRLRDAEGNEVEMTGDQAVTCTPAGFKPHGGSTSPRCREPGRPYSRAGAAGLPLPGEAPPPRLIVVYGDGEAEELLEARQAREALQLARKDPDAVLMEGEPMGRPMERCRCHTIYRTASSDARRVPGADSVLPPCVAGAAGAPGRPGCCYTELRQLVEYPPLTGEERKAFLDAWARFDAREELNAGPAEGGA